MKKLLIADDEKQIRVVIREYGEFNGYEVFEADNGLEALKICRQEDIDIIVMDIMMPVMDGFTAYQEIRGIQDIPAIMLSARGEEYDKLFGFKLGVDDYVVKPFSPRELMARIGAVLARKEGQAQKGTSGKSMTFNGLTIDLSGRNVLIDGKKVMMTPKEYELLTFLAINKNIVFTREQLLEKVWGFAYGGDDRTVDSHVKMLRRSLENYRDLIVTSRGAGYKFEER